MSHEFPDVVGYSTIADVNFPPEVCSTIFLRGCNFRCPYCINRDLLGDKKDSLNVNEILSAFWIRKEKKIVVSGGEPFCHDNIQNLFEKIKSIGISVAVATNGSFPSALVDSVERRLVDHVIMDIKTSLNRDRYSKAVGVELSEHQFEDIVCSINYLRNIPRYFMATEFRTTICSKFVSKEDVFSIARYLGKGKVYFLQPFTTHQTLDPEIANQKYVIPYEEISQWAREIDDSIVSACFVRDV